MHDAAAKGKLWRMTNMRGYFGVGVEGISKPMNAGNLIRTAHAFGASFAFFIAPHVNIREVEASDTSSASGHLPLYTYKSIKEFTLPRDCTLVGIELVEDAIELPSFRHPLQAAYLFGPEMGSISPEMQEKCDYIVQIPAKFCINVGMAGVVTLYDRMISLGRFAERPVRAGGPPKARVKAAKRG